jgi:hypothetical protein
MGPLCAGKLRGHIITGDVCTLCGETWASITGRLNEESQSCPHCIEHLRRLSVALGLLRELRALVPGFDAGLLARVDAALADPPT